MAKQGLTTETLVVLPEENQHECEEVLRGFQKSLMGRLAKGAELSENGIRSV